MTCYVFAVGRTAGRLQQEIKQTRPFASIEQEAFLGILRTADDLRRGLAGEIGRHGLTLQQYNVLRILRGAGKVGLPTLEVAGRLIERTPGITRFLDALERRKLVRRRRRSNDRRQVICRVTAAGLALLDKLDEPVNRWHRQRLAALRQAELTGLIRLLDRVRDYTTGNSLGEGENSQ